MHSRLRHGAPRITPLGQAALALAQRGLQILPLWPRSKKPFTQRGLMDATTDKSVITNWWRAKPDLNIAIATGAQSNVWALDVDGLEGERTLRRLEAKHGALPATVESITGDGRHLLFHWPADAEIRNSQLRVDVPGLDWRGEGGFIVSPPSWHPTGKQYHWSVDAASGFAAAPDWLLDLVAGRREGEREPTCPEEWRSFIGETFDGSHRAPAIARLAGHLMRRYVDPLVAVQLCAAFNATRCVEPLADEEVARICDDIAARELARRQRGGGP
jgi:Bifunctional DNA primase/polymerase, N-terminal